MIKNKHVLELLAIKTKKCVYLSDNVDNESYHSSRLGGLFFDGKKAIPSFHEEWFIVEKMPEFIERNTPQPSINHRYGLIDSSIASNKIPIILRKEDVVKNNGEWKKEYESLRSLYLEEYDAQPDKMVVQEFKITHFVELDEIKEFNGFSYPVQKTNYSQGGFTALTEKSVKHQLLDRILFPNIILPSMPCKITSHETYKIIRKFVQDNIDPKISTITSDYNFCFAVSKKIELVEPKSYTVDVDLFNSRKRKHKIVTKYRTHREVGCFEMTYSPECYKEYTPIKAFEGKSHEDLKKNIDGFLKNLIADINKPIKDCPHCEGMGVIIT